jgi:hypothetical protein
LCVCGLSAAICIGGCLEPSDSPGKNSWTFENELPNERPVGWTIAATKPTAGLAKWQTQRDGDAPSNPNVLALAHTENYDGAFNLAIAKGPAFGDFELTVQVKAVKGEEDQGGGPIWRCQDEDNYYTCRFNPLESNFRVYVVADGKRRQLGSTHVMTRSERWYEIRVRMVGQRIECWLEGRHPLSVTDGTFSRPGHVGLWTKADAVTSFDDLRVQPLDAAAQP